MRTTDIKRSSLWIAALAGLAGACGDDAGAGTGETGIELPTGGDTLDGGTLEAGTADETADGVDDGPGDCGPTRRPTGSTTGRATAARARSCSSTGPPTWCSCSTSPTA